jgi:hypothetical protein
MFNSGLYFQLYENIIAFYHLLSRLHFQAIIKADIFDILEYILMKWFVFSRLYLNLNALSMALSYMA